MCSGHTIIFSVIHMEYELSTVLYGFHIIFHKLKTRPNSPLFIGHLNQRQMLMLDSSFIKIQTLANWGPNSRFVLKESFKPLIPKSSGGSMMITMFMNHDF